MFLHGSRRIAATAQLVVMAVILTATPADSFTFVPSSSPSLSFSTHKTVEQQSQSARSCTQLHAEAIKITMPALSSTMKEGRVVSWLKSEGDAIEAGEAIMVVESDKADMDVEAFEDGFLAKIITGEGESASVGDVVALVSSLEEEIESVIAHYEGAGSATNGATAGAAAAADTPTTGTAANAGESSLVPRTEIYMPALSSTMSEGKVVEWLKNVGDFCQAGDAIMVVESDKADMDVELFEDGYLAEIIVDAGSTADVGAPVGVFVNNEQDLENYNSQLPRSSMSSSPPFVPTTVDSTNTLGAAAAAPEVPFSQIDMPALSSTMKKGKVVSWLKGEGDAISAGEAIMVVESDKADMDVEAFEDGFLAAIITGEGEVGAVGAPVALIAENEADIPALQVYAATLSGMTAPVVGASPSAPAVSSAPATTAAAAPKQASAAATGDRVVASPLAKKRAQELGLDISLVVGTGPEGRITAGDVEAFSSSGATTAAAPQKGAVATASAPAWTPAPGVIAATPMARALAKKAKFDIAKITGTGEFGRVTADDVLIATGQKEPERKKAPTSSGAPVVELPSGFVPFTGMQRAVSNNMMATLSIPEFRVSREIEMDKFDDLYQKLKPKGVTVSAMLAKAVALAIEKHPIINSAYDEQGGAPGIRYNKDINIAMAVAIEGGLITPTLKYANERSIEELGENWKELVGKAKTGGLTPDEYNSGTFTISNMGMFGVTDFGAILPAGSGAILAIGATQEFIVPCNAAVLGMKKVKKMKITLTCDHRQIYGSDAALFLKTLADVMENQLSKIA